MMHGQSMKTLIELNETCWPRLQLLGNGSSCGPSLRAVGWQKSKSPSGGSFVSVM